MHLHLTILLFATMIAPLYAYQPRSNHIYQRAQSFVTYSRRPKKLADLIKKLAPEDLEALLRDAQEINKQRKQMLDELKNTFAISYDTTSVVDEVMHKASIVGMTLSAYGLPLGAFVAYVGACYWYAVVLVPIGISLAVVASCVLGISAYGFFTSRKKIKVRRAWLKFNQAQQIVHILEQEIAQPRKLVSEIEQPDHIMQFGS